MSSLRGKGAGRTAQARGRGCERAGACARASAGLNSKPDSPRLHAHPSRVCPIAARPPPCTRPRAPRGWGQGRRREPGDPAPSPAGACREGRTPTSRAPSLPAPFLHSRAAPGPPGPMAGLLVHGLSRRAAAVTTGQRLHFYHEQLGALHPQAAARLLVLQLPGAAGPLGEEVTVQHPAPPHPGPPPSHPPREPPPSPGSRRPLQSSGPSDWGLYIPRHTCVPVCARAHVTRRPAPLLPPPRARRPPAQDGRPYHCRSL